MSQYIECTAANGSQSADSDIDVFQALTSDPEGVLMYCNSAAKCNCGAERPHSIPIQGLMNKPRTKSKSQKFATVLKQAKPVGKTLGWYIAPHNVAVLQHNCRRARNTNPLAKLKLLQHRVFT